MAPVLTGLAAATAGLRDACNPRSPHPGSPMKKARDGIPPGRHPHFYIVSI
jgi:hypothetical protein